MSWMTRRGWRLQWVWPWVSRVAYDTALLLAEREHENAMVLRSQLVDVTSKYHELRRAGSEAPVKPVIVHRAKERDPLGQAIVEVAGTDARKRAAMLQQLKVDRLTGRNESEIMAEILEGIAVNDGTPI